MKTFLILQLVVFGFMAVVNLFFSWVIWLYDILFIDSYLVIIMNIVFLLSCEGFVIGAILYLDEKGEIQAEIERLENER